HRLATVQAVLLGLPRLRELRQLAAQVDQVLVALGPVAEEAELLADRVLRGLRGRFEREGGCGGVGHGYLLSQPRRQRTPAGVSSSSTPSAASWSRIASARAKARAFLAAARSSTSAWLRASFPSAPPPLNPCAGSCCSRPIASPAPSSSPLARARASSSPARRASPAMRASSASACGVFRSSSSAASMLAGITGVASTPARSRRVP